MDNIFAILDNEDAQDEDIKASFLPQLHNQLNHEGQFEKLMFIYESAIRQMTTKLQILDREFQHSNDRNPIDSIKSRLKTKESILIKMERRGLPLTITTMVNNIYDIAGIRVICPFITDVYHIAQMLITQTDVDLVEVKDYIKDPKPNGYRSLHLIVKITVFFSETTHQIPVEIQLRTIAMNFWASTEHQLRYKKDADLTPDIHRRLKECADLMADADYQMQKLAEEIHF